MDRFDSTEQKRVPITLFPVRSRKGLVSCLNDSSFTLIHRETMPHHNSTCGLTITQLTTVLYATQRFTEAYAASVA